MTGFRRGTEARPLLTDNHELWGELSEQPTFVLTADQDWAPDWALASMLDLVGDAGVPLHLFVTSASAVLESHGRADLSTGLHPNFLPGSSHGETPEAVVDTCLTLTPGASTFRSHALMESSSILQLLVSKGMQADSNLCLYLQPRIVPLMHAAGLLRFPIFLEDDDFLSYAGPEFDVGSLGDHLLSPGLKVFNFHPALVALNAPSLAHYDDCRDVLFRSGEEIAPHTGRGVRDVLDELIELVHDNGYRFRPFLDLVAESRSHLLDRLADGLGGWHLA